MADQSTIQVRVDKVLEQRARKLASTFGLTLPDLVRLFLSAFVRNPHIEIGASTVDRKEPKRRGTNS